MFSFIKRWFLLWWWYYSWNHWNMLNHLWWWWWYSGNTRTHTLNRIILGGLVGSLFDVDGFLISSQFGECGVHFVGKRLVSVFVETELVCNCDEMKILVNNSNSYYNIYVFGFFFYKFVHLSFFCLFDCLFVLTRLGKNTIKNCFKSDHSKQANKLVSVR